MNPRDFLITAANLIASYDQNDWRTAASRAYYGAFLVCCELFEACHFVLPPDGSAHGYVADRLRNCGYRPLEVCSTDLRGLRSHRNWADYRMRVAFNHALAVQMCDHADEIVATLDVALASPTILATITTATADYERRTYGSTTHRPPPPPATPTP